MSISQDAPNKWTHVPAQTAFTDISVNISTTATLDNDRSPPFFFVLSMNNRSRYFIKIDVVWRYFMDGKSMLFGDILWMENIF